MLRLESLKIRDFGPFKGTQTIDFTTEDGVTIIWGNNGRGKTVLLNAFRYALFGFVKSRHGKYDDYLGLTNLEEKESGNYGFSITLKMSNNDDSYLLTRDVHLRDGVIVPRNNEDFIEDFFLKKNGNLLSNQARDHELNLIMPEDISRFFLFDGELLQEYEELLNDASDDGRKIKESIEKILGMPILTNSVADIVELENEYRTEKNRAAQNDKNTAELANSISILTDQIKGHEIEQKRLQDALKEENAQLDIIQQKMDDTEKLRGLLAEHKSKSEARDGYIKQRDVIKTEIQNLMEKAWQGVVAPVVDSLERKIKSELDAYNTKQSTAKVSKTMMKELEKTIDDCHCTLCNQDVEPNVLDVLKSKLNEMKAQHPDISEEERRVIQSLQDRLSSLQALNLDSVGSEVRSSNKLLNQLNIQISDADQEIRELSTQIKTYGEVDPTTLNLVDDYTKCKEKIRAYKEGIEKEEKAIRDAKDKRNKLDDKVNQLSSNKDVVAATRKLELCEHIREIFEKGVDSYRLELKASVERDASDLFIHMSADPDYSKLIINDNYGLDIEHSSGQIVPFRSAGYEHVVALSLIGALHKNAPLQGPVIMDSPYGRLDPDHKQNVTKNLPSIANQVILVVYKGEIKEEEARKLLGGNLIKEYVFDRITSFHTDIKEA